MTTVKRPLLSTRLLRVEEAVGEAIAETNAAVEAETGKVAEELDEDEEEVMDSMICETDVEEDTVVVAVGSDEVLETTLVLDTELLIDEDVVDTADLDDDVAVAPTPEMVFPSTALADTS